ncbi:MAG: metallophosphoesterase [Terracidiphilus sp.]
MKAWPILGISLMQVFLFSAHWFIYFTLTAFYPSLSPSQTQALKLTIFILAFSFIFAALLSFRFSNPLVTAVYRIAAVWLGFLNFFFFAACLTWLLWFALKLLPISANPASSRPIVAAILFGLALLAGIYGLINARFIRIRRVTVKLPGLPSSWQGRTALLASDLHLGNINGLRFCRRIATLAARLQPDVIFLPGDLFDGTRTDPDCLIAPLKTLAPPFGVYFSIGNHEEFGSAARYTQALTHAGVRVLNNEKVTVDGLHILGVPYADSNYPIRLRATLESLRPPPGQAGILLNHAPHRLPIVEQAGICLQLSGHTHGGQLFPFTWLTRRVFGQFTTGLHAFGALQVYTSAGAGTWGPPMRLGTSPEIVLLHFE